MIPPEILSWLEQPTSFAAGVALFDQHGGSAVYRQLFALGETSYSRQVLVQQLRQCCGVVGPVPAAVVVDPPASAPGPAPTPPTAVAQPDAPDLVPIRARLRGIRDERSQLHAQLTAPRLSKNDRGRMALRIIELTLQEMEQKKLEAHVLQHGQLPAGPVALIDVADKGELRRLLSNLVAQRARLRKKPERAADLALAEADILLIRTKLNPPLS